MGFNDALSFLLALSLLLPLAAGDDAAAMGKLAAAFSSSKPSDWSNGTDICSWSGVSCDSSNRVTVLNLASKSLSGTLPSQLDDLTQLKKLSLQNNALTGPLPSLPSLSLLQDIYLDSNNFSSVPSAFFDGLPALQTFSIGQNLDLDPWEIPSELTQCTSLVTFSASNANLYGAIPDIFSTLPNLQYLRLSYNNLTGPLPPSLAGSAIQNLWLNNQDQGLSGTVQVLSNMTQLHQAWLHKNMFTGPIPDLSKCDSLFDLQLRDNQFTGLIPASLPGLTSLANVSLRNNILQGPSPVFPKGVQASVDNNKFCTTDGSPCDAQVSALLEVAGALSYPVTLAEGWEGNDACQNWKFVTCQAQGNNVTIVNFGRQGFNGTISPAFANLTSLKNLYLNDNNLSGSIPSSLTALKMLQVVDLSNNNLTGQVPVFPSAAKLTTTGNPFLGKDASPAPAPAPAQSSGSSISVGGIVGIVAAALVFLGIVSLVCFQCYLKRRNQKPSKVNNHLIGAKNKKMKNSNCCGGGFGFRSNELLIQRGSDVGEFHVSEGGSVAMPMHVLRQVTNDFSEFNILGRGGFGVVYKGEWPDGTKVAVKRMQSVSMGSKGMGEFQAEIAVLTKVRHRHLVALLGYCVTDDERLLVYEHMPKGNLGQHLFHWRENGFPPLTWKQRVTIALDVAKGVEYLHSLAQESFIHRDLKPTNVLLGDDMRAKVADFGLVKNAPDGMESLETRLAGTFGYLAPEYAATGRVTTKVDVYAFGVVLMELITGRKVLDNTFPDERSHLLTWFRRILINKESMKKAIDQTLEPDDETFHSISKVAELAGHCTAPERSQRPDMGHAVNVLSPLVQVWIPTEREEEVDLHTSLPQAIQRWQAEESTSMTSDRSYSQSESSIPPKSF